MTGAATVVWFLGRKPKARPAPESIELDKSPSRVEAQQALHESAARNAEATGQRGLVTRVVSSLAEVRENNHFAENIRAAMGGDT